MFLDLVELDLDLGCMGLKVKLCAVVICSEEAGGGGEGGAQNVGEIEDPVRLVWCPWV